LFRKQLSLNTNNKLTETKSYIVVLSLTVKLNGFIKKHNNL